MVYCVLGKGMRKIIMASVLFLGCFGLISQGLAVMVNHLSQTVVPVDSRSDDQLPQAFRQAFVQVLVKMSGNPYVMTLPVIQNAMTGVSRWVQSYSYSTGDENQSNTLLQVTFDRDSVQQLLKQAGQSVWGRDRPLTLITVSQAGDFSQTGIALDRLLADNAKLRGLPAIFPVMDLTDRGIMGDAPLILSNDKLTALAKRYGVASILSGSLKQLSADAWQSDWRYIFNGQVFRWRLTGKTELSVILPAFDKMTSEMVNQLAASDSDNSHAAITLEVVGVNDISDYAQVMHALKQREDVNQVAVQSVNDNGVLFSLEVNGTLDVFKAALEKSADFKPVNAALKQDAEPADLYFYWVPQTTAAVKAVSKPHDTV